MNATGSDIFRKFLEGLLTLKVLITSICSITTDGAQSTNEKSCEFVSTFNQHHPCGDRDLE